MTSASAHGESQADVEGVTFLESDTPKIFWIAQVLLSGMWAARAVSALLSDQGGWQDWVTVAVVGFGYLLIAIGMALHVRDGGLRVEVTNTGIVVRTHLLRGTIQVPWTELARVVMKTSRVELIRRDGREVAVPLGTYHVVRAVKDRLATAALQRNIQVEGYW